MTNIPSPRHRETQTQHTDCGTVGCRGLVGLNHRIGAKEGCWANHHKTPTTPPFALPKMQLGACIFEPVWRMLCDSRQCEKGSDVVHHGQESHSAGLAAPPDLAGIIISPTVLMRKRSGASHPQSSAGGEASSGAMMGLQGPLPPTRHSTNTAQVS